MGYGYATITQTRCDDGGRVRERSYCGDHQVAAKRPKVVYSPILLPPTHPFDPSVRTEEGIGVVYKRLASEPRP